MKPSRRHSRSFLNLTVCLCMTVLPGTALATTTRYWNAGGTGGDGNWGTSPGDKNWNLVPGAAVGNTAWPNTIDDAANFQTTTGGTVTVFGDVQTTRITQNGADYTVNAGNIALVRDTSAAAPVIDVATGTLTIDSLLVGSDGLRKMGPANLVLSGANAFTGATSVETGTLTLTGSLVSGVVRIDPTGTLNDVSGGLASTTALRNLGILTVSAPETVATYLQEIGATFSGAGPLTATAGSILSGGTVAGSLLGNTTITGAVLVSGTLGGGSLSVANTGTLTLTGSYTGSSVTIALNGGLVDANGGLADIAAVTNTGTLTVNAEDYISTYLQNVGGTLAGPGILNVTGGATLAGGTVSGNLAADIVATGSVTISGNVTGNSLSVQGGMVALSGQSTHVLIGISANSSLSDLSGGLADHAEVTNSGLLDVYSDDTVRVYIQNGGGSRLGGDSTLTVTDGIVLNGGSVSGKLFGNAISTGAVVVSGEIGGGILAVNGGTFSLSGVSTHSLVEIATNARFNDLAAGLDAGAAIINHGILAVENSNDTVRTYLQDGSGILSGVATLIVTNGATLHGGEISGNLLGNTVSTGNVLISGTIGGGNLAVTGGTLRLTGVSDNLAISVSAGSSMVVTNSGLSSLAAVTNAGRLTFDRPDTIATYVQNGIGSLEGTGALTTTGGATLNGGTVSGGLLGNTVSTGNVLVSGMIGGGNLAVTGGTLRLTGVSDNLAISVSAGGSMVVTNSGLNSAAAVTNAGSLTFDLPDTVFTYVQNGDGILAGAGALTATGGATLNGGTISGGLLGNTVSTGNVLVSGTIGGGNLAVTGGTLTLTGISNNQTIQISPFASLLDSHAGLSPLANVANAGRLALDVPDEILTYVSDGGLLEGAGKLSVTSTAALNDHSSVVGSLAAGSITTQGAVSISGSAVSDRIRIGAGVLTNTGLLGSATTHLDLAAGATLVASGTQFYNILTTSGAGPARWQGNLQNFTTVAPGGDNAFGNLQVTGNFTNAPGGTLAMDVAAAGHDQLGVGGTATFGGTLSVNQVGLDQIPSFVPIQLVSAAAYTGNFAALQENLDGIVFFNPLNGSLTRVGLGSGGGSLFSGTTRNQRSTWISLYDDVIDPGKTNITRGPSGYAITSGIADVGNPDLLRTLAASFTPAGLDTNLLNHLSAEIYTSVLDYAVQATRQHQRTALSAPALAPRADIPGYSSKSSAKDAIPATPSLGRNWEFFAAADYFHAETDTSQNHADYELSGAGFVLGARNQLTDRFQLAGYAAADTGSIDGSLIDSDQNGWSLGLIGETLLGAKSHTILTTALSYGSYKSDGTRQSAASTAAGWNPGKVQFDNIDSDSLELYAGVETTVYRDQRFRVVPSAGLRYTSGTMDGFTESTRTAPGSPIALKVNRDSYDQWTMEMGIAAAASLTDQFTLQGQFGFNAGLGGNQHDIQSRFVKGNRSNSAEADGLTNDLFYLGLGLEYRINQDIILGAGYRSDFRPNHPIEQGCNVSSSFRF